MPSIGDKSFATDLVRATKLATEKTLGDDAYVKRYVGKVSAVDYTTNSASVYILGSSSASTGFRIRQGAVPLVNDNVVVAILGQQRWVEAVLSGEAYPKVGLTSDGQLQFGAGSGAFDTNLYRGAANTLKTDDKLVAGATSSAKDQVTIPDTTAGAGLTIGGDTNLYRSAANVLATDDSFNAPTIGAFYSSGAASTIAAAGSAYLAWGTKGYDTGNSYNATTKVWTVPSNGAGIYLAVARCNIVNQTAGTTSMVRFNLSMNGAFWTGTAMGTAGTNTGQTMSAIALLSAGDTIYLTANPIGNQADCSISYIAIVRLHSLNWSA